MRNIYLVFITVILFVGCGQKERTNELNNSEALPNEVEQTANKNDMMQTNEEIAEHLASIANDVPNVHDEAAIVAGPFTVVAVGIGDLQEDDHRDNYHFSCISAYQHASYARSDLF